MGRLIAIIALLILVTISGSHAKTTKKCRALALEGGGDQGSYQVGVLKSFVEYLPAEEVQYDVITGVSVGSINAMALAMHKIGDEKSAVDWMIDMWTKLKPTDIYGSWNFGILEGLFFEEGIWTNQNEVDFLTETFNNFEEKKVHRKININTVDFDTGKIYKFTEAEDFSRLPSIVVASTSMPFAFPHMRLDGHAFVDGGSVWNVDISGAIQRCMEVVDDEKDIIVDVILCNTAQKVRREDTKNWSTMNNYFRYQQISKYYSFLSDYEEIERGYPDVNFRYILVPKDDLPSSLLTLDFEHEAMMQMIKIGEDQARELIQSQA